MARNRYKSSRNGMPEERATWISETDSPLYICSTCGYASFTRENKCPACRRKMSWNTYQEESRDEKKD